MADRPTQLIDDWSWPAEYERYAGRWSRAVAERFVTWLAPKPEQDWLDVGCGTGALSEAVLRLALPSSIVGVDRSAAFIESVRSSIPDARARFVVASAMDLPIPDASADVTVSGLVLNFLPDVAAALREQTRVTRSGGWVAGYLWDYAGGMEFMRLFWDAAVELDAAAHARDEAVRFPIARPRPLRRAWRDAGLRSVSVEPLDLPTVFRDFDDFWSPFLSRIGPAPSYLMSLPEGARLRLAERLRGTLPIAADGTIPLTARAWAVRGQRP